MKILLLDIETAPNLVHVWGLWKQNVGLPQIIDAGYVMCWSAKWYGDKETYFSSVNKESPKDMLHSIHDLLDQADVVVHYNGSSFDIPTLNKEFVLYGLPPPAPYKQVDLLLVARKQFRFPSNKLDYVAQALKLGKKTKHSGHELWIKCMANDPESWKQMEEYNKNDVILLEKVYDRFRPWIKGTTNYGLYRGDSLCCPACGGTRYQRRGFAYTTMRKYQRYQCSECGSWFRNSHSEPKEGGTFANVTY